ncbi:MAG: hypothetical protein [Olavius algarvensis Gamma 1 endosymbiont]|nr:MAG: hypothetical protein [Olavius algarvensis Gamma 1 endosymbiont]
MFFSVSSVFSVDPLFFSRTTNQHEYTRIDTNQDSCTFVCIRGSQSA